MQNPQFPILGEGGEGGGGGGRGGRREVLLGIRGRNWEFVARFSKS